MGRPIMSSAHSEREEVIIKQMQRGPISCVVSLAFTVLSRLLGLFWLALSVASRLNQLIATVSAKGRANPINRQAVLDKLYEDTKEIKHHNADLGNGRVIHYVETGAKKGPLVLFLHGFPEFWYSWRHQLSGLKNIDHCLVAMDLRGYGRSHKPTALEDYKIAPIMSEVNDFITHLGHQSCILVAHDWGGVVAWSFAHYYPHRVTKLAIINCPHPSTLCDNINTPFRNLSVSLRNVISWPLSKTVEYGRNQVITPLIRLFYQYVVKSNYIHMIRLPAGIAETLFSADDIAWLDSLTKFNFSKSDIDKLKAVISNGGSKGSKHILTSMMAYYRAPTLLLSSEKIIVNVPTTIIWGERDSALDRDLSLKGVDKFVPNVDICFLDANHFVHQQMPNEVNELLRGFIAR